MTKGQDIENEAVGRMDVAAEEWRWKRQKGTSTYETEWGKVHLTDCSRAVIQKTTRMAIEKWR